MGFLTRGVLQGHLLLSIPERIQRPRPIFHKKIDLINFFFNLLKLDGLLKFLFFIILPFALMSNDHNLVPFLT